MEKVKAPTGLQKAGKALWDDVANTYELNVDEVRILEEACFTADQIATFTQALRNAPLFVPGSKGQEVVNPLHAEVRASRTLLAKLLKQLDLPDVHAQPGERSARSLRAAAAANSRWNRVRAAQQG